MPASASCALWCWRSASTPRCCCVRQRSAAPAISQGQPRARSLPLPVPSALGVRLRAEGPGSLPRPPAGRGWGGAARCGAGAGAPAAPAARSSLRCRHVPVPGRLAGAGRSPQPGSLGGRPAAAPRYGWGGDMGRDGTGQVRRARAATVGAVGTRWRGGRWRLPRLREGAGGAPHCPASWGRLRRWWRLPSAVCAERVV